MRQLIKNSKLNLWYKYINCVRTICRSLTKKMIKVISLFVVLIPFVTLSQAELKCGIHKNDLQTRIIGSETVRNHAFPWMTFLMLSYYEPDGKLKGYTCGASLIAKQWLLTSAHCLAITKSSKFASGVAILGTNIVSIRHQSKDSIQINFGPKNVSCIAYY